jgi:hypothetical protein
MGVHDLKQPSMVEHAGVTLLLVGLSPWSFTLQRSGCCCRGVDDPRLDAFECQSLRTG